MPTSSIPWRSSKWLNFERDLDSEKGKKTMVFDVVNKGGYPLGKVKWYAPWRQYCFYPWGEDIFAKSCLDDISAFIASLMAERA